MENTEESVLALLSRHVIIGNQCYFPSFVIKVMRRTLQRFLADSTSFIVPIWMIRSAQLKQGVFVLTPTDYFVGTDGPREEIHEAKVMISCWDWRNCLKGKPETTSD